MRVFLKTILILICSISVGACNPLKVTDPSDPNFDPDKFSFRDNFFDREAKIDAFRKLFPPGTPKAFVAQVLVAAGGAKNSQGSEFPDEWPVWRYDVPPVPGYPAGPVHIFIFNVNNEVENISFAANEYLYPSRKTKKQLRQMYKLKEK